MSVLLPIQQGAASHLVFCIEGVSPSSDQHVLVSVQHAPHRPLQPDTSRSAMTLMTQDNSIQRLSAVLVCCHGDHGGQDGAPALLPAKASAHPLDPDHHPVVRDAQDLRNQALTRRRRRFIDRRFQMLSAGFRRPSHLCFTGILGRNEELHLAVLSSGHSQCDVCLQVEMFLTPDVDFTCQNQPGSR